MTRALKAEKIVAWLRQRPDFFVSQPQLLAEMHIPHETGATSLLEHQARVLREQNTKLHERLEQLIQTAQENDRLFQATRTLVLDLLAAGSLDDLLVRTENGLRRDFKVPAISLMLFLEAGEEPLATSCRQLPRSDAERAISGLLAGNAQLCSAVREEERAFLFAGQASTIQSAAVLPLRGERLYGLLALGSEDAERYRGTLDTLFLDYLGEVLPRLLRRFIPVAKAGRS